MDKENNRGYLKKEKLNSYFNASTLAINLLWFLFTQTGPLNRFEGLLIFSKKSFNIGSFKSNVFIIIMIIIQKHSRQISDKLFHFFHRVWIEIKGPQQLIWQNDSKDKRSVINVFILVPGLKYHFYK